MIRKNTLNLKINKENNSYHIQRRNKCNNIEGNNEKNKINDSWIVGNENNGIDIVNDN